MGSDYTLSKRARYWLDYLFSYSREERRHSNVGPPKLWKMKRDFQIRFLRQVGLQPQDYLLDLGCGTLRGGIPIIEYLDQGHYFGIEVRAEVLDEGRKELREAKLEDRDPTLIAAADVSRLDLDREFDYIWAFSVLIHMQDEILFGALDFMQRHLKEDGNFYGNVNISDKLGKNVGRLGFPVVHRSLQFYEEACARNGLRVEDLGPLTDFGHTLPDRTLQQQATQRMLRICKA